jgi:hypothetical protein
MVDINYTYSLLQVLLDLTLIISDLVKLKFLSLVEAAVVDLLVVELVV